MLLWTAYALWGKNQQNQKQNNPWGGLGIEGCDLLTSIFCCCIGNHLCFVKKNNWIGFLMKTTLFHMGKTHLWEGLRVEGWDLPSYICSLIHSKSWMFTKKIIRRNNQFYTTLYLLLKKKQWIPMENNKTQSVVEVLGVEGQHLNLAIDWFCSLLPRQGNSLLFPKKLIIPSLGNDLHCTKKTNYSLGNN